MTTFPKNPPQNTAREKGAANNIYESNEPSYEGKSQPKEPKMTSRPESPRIELSASEPRNIQIAPSPKKQRDNQINVSRLSFETLGGMPENKGLNTVKAGEASSTLGNQLDTHRNIQPGAQSKPEVFSQTLPKPST